MKSKYFKSLEEIIHEHRRKNNYNRKNAKLANKQKSTFDKANKNKGFSKVQQFPRIEEITKISKKRMH